MGAALKFKQANVPRQSGEQARLKVIQGPDYGAIYVITGAKATIGRGEDSDVMISDLKASRLHATMFLTGGAWSLRDMGSANGLLWNGQPTRDASLKFGDTVTIGETTLEFMPSTEAGTQMLIAPPKSLSQVQAEQAAFAAQRARVRALSQGSSHSGGAAGAGKDNKRILIYGGLALGALLFFFSTPAKKPPAKPAAQASKGAPKGADGGRNLSSYLPSLDPIERNKNAEMFFRAGFREFREKNYIRARNQFETVLQIVPAHPLATIYLNNCNNAIEEEVKFHLEKGKRSMTAGKLREARGHFEQVQRLLYRDQSNHQFKEATESLETVAKQMKGEGA